MNSLIVDDDFITRMLMQKFLAPYGECHTAINGKEAITVFEDSLKSGEPYDLVCLDIMMPEMDGQHTLSAIRTLEESRGIMIGDGVKVIMTTAVGDMNSKLRAFNESCDAYLVKPIERANLIEKLRSFHLID
jgi:two-component system chemotaxis response regulator CheY